MKPKRSRSGAGQQAGAGGGADQGERREFKRDGGGTGALADHDVDAEVFHRHVEHFLGRPGHPVDLVEEEDFAFGKRGQDGCQVPCVLDGGTAADPQRGVHFGRNDHGQRGLAQPGGPESSTWSALRPRMREASRTRESCLRTRCWPTKSCRFLGLRAASMTRSSGSSPPPTTDGSATGAYPVPGAGAVLAQPAEGGTQDLSDVALLGQLG